MSSATRYIYKASTVNSRALISSNYLGIKMVVKLEVRHSRETAPLQFNTFDFINSCSIKSCLALFNSGVIPSAGAIGSFRRKSTPTQLIIMSRRYSIFPSQFSLVFGIIVASATLCFLKCGVDGQSILPWPTETSTSPTPTITDEAIVQFRMNGAQPTTVIYFYLYFDGSQTSSLMSY